MQFNMFLCVIGALFRWIEALAYSTCEPPPPLKKASDSVKSTLVAVLPSSWSPQPAKSSTVCDWTLGMLSMDIRITESDKIRTKTPDGAASQVGPFPCSMAM